MASSESILLRIKELDVNTIIQWMIANLELAEIRACVTEINENAQCGAAGAMPDVSQISEPIQHAVTPPIPTSEGGQQASYDSMVQQMGILQNQITAICKKYPAPGQKAGGEKCQSSEDLRAKCAKYKKWLI